MNVASWITYVYGAIVLLGGIMGYVAAKSTMSLIAGVASGIILLASGWAMSQGRNWAVPLAAVVMVALMLFFGRSYLNDPSKVRNAAMAGLSLLALIAVLLTSRAR